MTAAADAFYRSGEGVILQKPIVASTNSPLDEALAAGDEALYGEWHLLIGGAFEGISVLGSKMTSTGGDYDIVEDAAREKASRMLRERYW